MTITYAVLGATGSTGSELVKHLLPRSDIQLHIYARSEAKLKGMFPELSSSKNVRIFTGTLSDRDTLRSCLTGVTTIFSTVAQNENDPKCRIAQNTVEAIVDALSTLRASSTPSSPFKVPKLVLISSASLDRRETAKQPWLVHKLVWNGCYYVYQDLRAAEAYLEREAPWIPVVRACAGGIVKSKEMGVSIDDGNGSPTVSYPDLANAMIMMAEDAERDWVGKQVGVVSKGEPEVGLLLRTNVLWFVLPGFICAWFPSMFPVLKRVGFFR